MQRAENKMSSQARVRSDARSLEVANFANHDDVRRLAQDGTQSRRKCHADLRIHLHLVDPGHLIFDRLFHGNDLAVWFVYVVEAGVKRGRFTGTGRASDEQNAIRQLDHTLEDFLVVRKKSKLWQSKLQAGLIQ